MFVLIGVSSGVTRRSQFRSFSFSERDNIKRFLGVDKLQTVFIVAECSLLFSADVLELLPEFWENRNLVSAQKDCQHRVIKNIYAVSSA